MIKELWQLGKQKRWTIYLQTFMEWLPSLFFPLFLWGVLIYVETGQISLLNGVVSVTVVGTLLMYHVFFSDKVSYSWAYEAKKELKFNYLDVTLNATQDPAYMASEMAFIQRDIKGIEKVDVFYQTFFPEVLKSIWSLFLLSVLLLLWSPLSILIVVSPFVLISGTIYWLRKNGSKINRRYIAQFMRLGDRFLDDLSGVNTLIMYQAEKKFAEKFAKDTEMFRKKTMELLAHQQKSLIIIDFFLFLTIGCFTFIQYRLWNIGEVSLVFVLVSIGMCIQFLLSTRKMGYFIHLVQSNKAALTHVFEVIKSDKNQETSERDFENVGKITNIQLNEVSFAYPNQESILSHVSFTFSSGKLWGIVGENGSGKSTLLKLIKRDNVPTEGRIIVNKAEELAQLSSKTIYSKIAYLGSEAFLFSGTIEENLMLGTEESLDWKKQLQKYGLCDFIDTLQHKEKTEVGENGRFLSPGQKQQIALARMVLADKEVYLLDEVTSNIDDENAQTIIHAMKELSKKKIVLFVTHRFQEMKHADHIHFIHQKKKISQGTHTELVHNNSEYNKLVTKQERMEGSIQ